MLPFVYHSRRTFRSVTMIVHSSENKLCMKLLNNHRLPYEFVPLSAFFNRVENPLLCQGVVSALWIIWTLSTWSIFSGKWYRICQIGDILIIARTKTAIQIRISTWNNIIKPCLVTRCSQVYSSIIFFPSQVEVSVDPLALGRCSSTLYNHMKNTCTYTSSNRQKIVLLSNLDSSSAN